MNAPLRIGLVLAAVVVAVVLLILLRPDSPEVADDTAATVTDVVPTDEAGTTEETETETETEATTEATTTQEAPDVVRAQIAIGPEGPSGVERIRARRGQRVILVVRSQLADHVHVHGYDLFADVAPGQPARIQFRADIPGRFEIELEDRHELIAQLRVDP